MKRKFLVLKDWLCYEAGEIITTYMSGELCVMDKDRETIVYLWQHDEVKEIFTN